MSKPQDRTVAPRPGGGWSNTRNDANRASSNHRTQAEAIAAAREMLGNQGGGELSIRGRDGRVRDKDTVHPGKDPYPPKG